MRKIVVLMFSCAVMGLLSISCAKKHTPSNIELQRSSFDAWMETYGQGAQKLESGIYIKKIVNSTISGAQTPQEKEWVQINYTGWGLLSGDMYITRDSLLAKQQGGYVPFTHYVPDFVQMVLQAPQGSKYYPIKGVYHALREMKEGDKWRVYIPADLAYGEAGLPTSSIAQGFQTGTPLKGNSAVMVDLELVKVVTNPAVYEIEQVQRYAVSVMNKGLNDTIGHQIYLQSHGYPEGAPQIKKDEYVNYYYVARFLDGFVYSTNVKDTAIKYNFMDYYRNLYDFEFPRSLRVTGDIKQKPIALDSALRNMHYGESAQLIFTSSTGYGILGSSDETVIQPYTPIIYDLWVSPQQGDGTYRFPYIIKGVQEMSQDLDGVWVIGYISGVVTGNDVSQSELKKNSETTIRSNIMFSTGWGATDYKLCIPIELKPGNYQDALNYPDNVKTLYTKRIKIFGDIRTIYGARGIVNVRDYKIYL